jgi:hypothetical protein
VKNRFQNLPFKCNLQRYNAGLEGGYAPGVYCASGYGKHTGRHGDAAARLAREASEATPPLAVVARYERSLTAMTPAVLSNGGGGAR